MKRFGEAEEQITADSGQLTVKLRQLLSAFCCLLSAIC